jgi:hypothetical protein
VAYQTPGAKIKEHDDMQSEPRETDRNLISEVERLCQEAVEALEQLRQHHARTYRWFKAWAESLADGQSQSVLSSLRALGLTAECDAEEIKIAYRKLSMTLHPDRGGDASAFVRMRENFEVAMKWATRQETYRRAARAASHGQGERRANK